MLRTKFCFLISFLAALMMAGCASGGSSGAPGGNVEDPCLENAPQLGSTSGPGNLLFFMSCGLWAVDPEKPDAPAQIVAAYKEPDPDDPDTKLPENLVPEIIPGSLQKIIGGTWNTTEEKVTDKHLHALLYAKGEGDVILMKNYLPGEMPTTGKRYRKGKFYRISAKKSASQKPLQVSSEKKANEMCGVVTVLEDYADINNSLYVYEMPGPDGDCGIRDDNIEKYITLGMGKDKEPVTLPRARDLFWTTELVDKNNGAIIGWLAIKTHRKQRRLPAYTAMADPGNEVLKPHKAGKPLMRYPLGFNTGTPILISGGGFDPDTTYFVNWDEQQEIRIVCPASAENDTVKFSLPPTPNPVKDGDLFNENINTLTFKNRLNLKLKKWRKLICLEDGTIIGDAKNINTADSKVTLTAKKYEYKPILFDASNEVLDPLGNDEVNEINGRRVIKTIVFEEDIKFGENEDDDIDKPVTFNTEASYIDLHRCNLELTECGPPLKETAFQTFCAEDGFDQIGNKGEPLDRYFVIGAYDRFKNPVDGDVAHWKVPLKVQCDGFGPFKHNCRPVYDDTNFIAGKTHYKGTLGDDDTKPGWNVFPASIDGIGSPLTFSASKPKIDTDGDGIIDSKDSCPGTGLNTPVNTDGCKDEKTGLFPVYTPPFCKMREAFYMLGVFPVSSRGSKAAFRGKIVVRIDLLYKPDWGNNDNDKANKVGTQGVLYVYDIAKKTFSTNPPYSTNDNSLGNLINKSTLKYISSHEATKGSKSSFPDGVLSVYDNNTFYFADFGKIYRLPLGESGKAAPMANEGARTILDMKLSSDSLVYTSANLDSIPPISAVNSVLKDGGAPIVLHPDTDKSVLNLITDQEWDDVYFQTLRTKADLPDPGVYSQIYSAKTNGSETRKETENAIMAGRTETRVLSVVGCNNKGLFVCNGGTLISSSGVNPSDQVSLGTLPDDIEVIHFQGFGENLLGEGLVDSEVYNMDIFHIRGNLGSSLTRSLSTPLIPEELL